MSKVYIINKSGHDYSKAEKFGTLIYLTEGEQDPDESNQHFRQFVNKMKDAKEGDYILITSLASMNAIAGWIFGTLGLNLNMLIFKGGRYEIKKLVPDLLNVKEEQND